MAEFVAAQGASAVPGEWSWRVIADDVSFKPLRFEITCLEPVRVSGLISRGNSQNRQDFAQVFPAGTSVVAVPNNIANRIRMTEDDTGDYWIEVGA